MIRIVLALLALVAWPAFAQAPVSPQVEARVATLVALLRDGSVARDDFGAAFIEQVPLVRLTEIAAGLRTDNGAVIGAAGVEAEGPDGARVRIDYDRAVVTARFALDPAAPHRFIGLLITDVARRDDSAGKIVADLRALPGRTSLLVTRLRQDPLPPPIVADNIIAYNLDQPLATGSQFKLFVLAELARQVAAGERRWSDVVPLGPPSLASGVTQGWPAGAPVTLSTLATQMISISDNTAADTLLGVLGRERVDAMRASVGLTPGALPVLMTREAFALKMAESRDLRARWDSADLADRRALLSANRWPLAAIDRAQLAGAPAHIDTVEWPATMTEIARILGRLRTADAHTLDILGIAPGLAPDKRSRFTYVGYKGGSESGVIALAWLLRTEAGAWYAVAGVWNDANAPVDTAKFAALLTRAVALVADR